MTWFDDVAALPGKDPYGRMKIKFFLLFSYVTPNKSTLKLFERWIDGWMDG
jgi:hypothetical protein